MDDLLIANDNGSDVAWNETRTPGGLVVKDHGNSMSLQEFGGWLEQNLGASVETALQQAAFMLCCDVISQDLSKATPRLRRRTSPTTSKVVDAKEHQIAALLALEPNRRHTWQMYTEMSVYWGLLTSNSYSVALRNNVGDPLEIIPVQPGRVRAYVEGRDVWYDVRASTQQEQALLGQPSMRVRESDMIHVRGRPLDGMDGYSTLVLGKQTLETGRALEAMREALFGEEGQMRGVFFREGAMPDDTMPDISFQRLRQQLKELMNRFRQMTEPVVLEGGMKFQPISSSPKDMEFAAQFSAQINATCRLLRVPPHKVFQMDGVKYENLETSEKMYVGDTLVPVAKRHEAATAKVLLTREERLEFYIEYDRDEMTLRDSQRETERIKTLVERGIVTIDEARAQMGFNPLPNGQGDVRLIPTNMSVVDKKGEVLIGGSSTPKSDVAPPADAPPADAPSKGVIRLVSKEA